MLSLSDRNVLCHILWSFRAVRGCERQDHPPPAPQQSPGESLCLCCYLCFFFSCVCVIPLSIGDRVPVAVLLWRGLWPHQRPGLQDSGERETWKVLTTSSLQLIHLDVGVLVFIIIIITTSSLQLIHMDVGDTISLVADELGYSLQYLLFCIHLEAAQY